MTNKNWIRNLVPDTGGHSNKTLKHKAAAPRPGEKAGGRLNLCGAPRQTDTVFHVMIISGSASSSNRSLNAGGRPVLHTRAGTLITLLPVIMWKPENAPSELMML